MYQGHVQIGYRSLTEREEENAIEAIDWLFGKHLNSHQIAVMSERCLDRKRKFIYVVMEKGRLAFIRRINYEGTPFEEYLTEVLPCLKTRTWIFPRLAWQGRMPNFGFHIKEEIVENYRQNHHKRVLIIQRQCGKIEVSETKIAPKKQIMVGRRLALRA